MTRGELSETCFRVLEAVVEDDLRPSAKWSSRRTTKRFPPSVKALFPHGKDGRYPGRSRRRRRTDDALLQPTHRLPIECRIGLASARSLDQRSGRRGALSPGTRPQSTLDRPG